jgi:hypothetical protein
MRPAGITISDDKGFAMKIKQLSVFLENKPGQLSAPVRALAEAKMDIVTLCLADTQQFGILRLIVREWEKAKDVLERAGCVVNVADVLAIEVTDQPGGLASLLEVTDREGINIEYMYAFTFGRDDKAILILRFEDADNALHKLQRSGVNVLAGSHLHQRTRR